MKFSEAPSGLSPEEFDVRFQELFDNSVASLREDLEEVKQRLQEMNSTKTASNRTANVSNKTPKSGPKNETQAINSRKLPENEFVNSLPSVSQEHNELIDELRTEGRIKSHVVYESLLKFDSTQMLRTLYSRFSRNLIKK